MKIYSACPLQNMGKKYLKVGNRLQRKVLNSETTCTLKKQAENVYGK